MQIQSNILLVQIQFKVNSILKILLCSIAAYLIISQPVHIIILSQVRDFAIGFVAFYLIDFRLFLQFLQVILDSIVTHQSVCNCTQLGVVCKLAAKHSTNKDVKEYRPIPWACQVGKQESGSSDVICFWWICADLITRVISLHCIVPFRDLENN